MGERWKEYRKLYGTVGAVMCLAGVVLLTGGGLYMFSAGFIVFSTPMDGESAFDRIGAGWLIAFLGWNIAMAGTFCNPPNPSTP